MSSSFQNNSQMAQSADTLLNIGAPDAVCNGTRCGLDESIGPLPGRLAGFARVRPLRAQSVGNTEIMSVAGAHIPATAALATESTENRTLQTIRDDGSSALDA